MTGNYSICRVINNRHSAIQNALSSYIISAYELVSGFFTLFATRATEQDLSRWSVRKRSQTSIEVSIGLSVCWTETRLPFGESEVRGDIYSEEKFRHTHSATSAVSAETF